uniref:Portal protein n=2 Tax=viral metagenome TaxID=1070528 RepID=A0A6M3K6S8_9ZZZZ
MESQSHLDQRNMIEGRKTALQGYWNFRDKYLLEDRDIINLEKPEKKLDVSNWITNEPKVFFDLARAMLSINKPKFRLPIIMDAAPDEKSRMNKAERLCIGIMRSLDDDVAERGGISWLWDLAYYVLLGWYAVFCPVEKTYDGIKFTADIWDPLNVYPAWDSYGLAECVRTYQTDKLTGRAMIESFATTGIEGEVDKEPITQDGQVEVTNYWKRTLPTGRQKKAKVENGIKVGGRLVKPMTHQTKMNRIPIHIGAIGSPDRSTALWMKHKGESVIHSNKEVYGYMNKMLQLMQEVMEQNTYPNRIWNLMNPGQTVPKAKGHGEDIRLKPNEGINLLRTATTPGEVAVLVDYFGKQAQKGSVSDMTYGNSQGADLSGFAISQLLASVKYKLGMYLNAMNIVTGRVFTDFLYQYRTGNFGKLTLATENPHDMQRGMTYLEEYTTEDVPKHIYVEVAIPISSQFDKTQAILNSVQAKQAGILSLETLWELEDLGVQDKELEKMRIRDDQVSEDPFFRQMEIIERMWVKEQEYRNSPNPEMRAKAENIKQYIMQLEQQIGLRQAIPVKPGQQGVSPQMAPPETRGAPTADQMGAFTRTPPPPGDRTQEVNRGRVGKLVSPTGQPVGG